MNTEINKNTTPEDEPPLFPEVMNGKQIVPTEAKKSNAGRKAKPDKETGVLQVRGVDQETKNLLEKAVKRSGKTAGQFMNTEFREFLQGIVKKSAQPPATEEDLKTLISSRMDEMCIMIEQTQKRQRVITPEEIAEKVAQIIAAKPDGERKSMFARVVEAIRG